MHIEHSRSELAQVHACVTFGSGRVRRSLASLRHAHDWHGVARGDFGDGLCFQGNQHIVRIAERCVDQHAGRLAALAAAPEPEHAVVCGEPGRLAALERRQGATQVDGVLRDVPAVEVQRIPMRNGLLGCVVGAVFLPVGLSCANERVAGEEGLDQARAPQAPFRQVDLAPVELVIADIRPGLALRSHDACKLGEQVHAIVNSKEVERVLERLLGVVLVQHLERFHEGWRHLLIAEVVDDRLPIALVGLAIEHPVVQLLGVVYR